MMTDVSSDSALRILEPQELLVENLYLVPRPIGFSEKLQAGFDRGVFTKAIDLDAEGEIIPAILFDQVREHPLKSDAVQGVVAHVNLLAVMGWNLNGKDNLISAFLNITAWWSPGVGRALASIVAAAPLG